MSLGPPPVLCEDVGRIAPVGIVQGQAQIAVGTSVCRPQFQRPPIPRDRRIGIANRLVGKTKLSQRLEKIRFKFDRPEKRSTRGERSPLSQQGNTKISVPGSEVRGNRNRGLKCFPSLLS